MFTGIIETLGTVRKIQQKESGNQVLEIQTKLSQELRPGQSLSHNGVCLTVESAQSGWYSLSLIPETLKKTMMAELKKGDTVNLERSLAADQRLDGHFVQGHADTAGKVLQIGQKQGNYEVTVEYPSGYEGLVVLHGSIALHGISLTISHIDSEKHCFTVCIIPHTYKRTNTASWKAGSRLNIEFDILGKYAQKLISCLAKS